MYRLKNQTGMALLVCMVILLLSAIAVISTTKNSALANRSSYLFQREATTFQLADSALHRSLRDFRDSPAARMQARSDNGLRVTTSSRGAGASDSLPGGEIRADAVTRITRPDPVGNSISEGVGGTKFFIYTTTSQARDPDTRASINLEAGYKSREVN
ncbi:hypothetical protein NX722_16695 [Endozoicomonas gorgoniicola]|uniref:Type 4 fimbrial biogenesis protein PilX N-terminal domain-containing protein n=1 Tax=Endozoicomonas gorgoniicola TaxID=1234144 RepID=A0ABT3MXW6_9GAMM|nr:hypothetical protein [Endozoicomonas gorgoniicola]MCW7554228.1 hypothetical protein [Endozoicomonas gorgoniicola]